MTNMRDDEYELDEPGWDFMTHWEVRCSFFYGRAFTHSLTARHSPGLLLQLDLLMALVPVTFHSMQALPSQFL